VTTSSSSGSGARSTKKKSIAYDSVGEAGTWIVQYLEFYNRKRPYSSLDARTPDRAYFNNLPQLAAA
jgi:putative transposase